jgi:hypothetical protein
MSLLGPNRHFEAGDERFHPDNIIICCRDLNATTESSAARPARSSGSSGPYYEHHPGAEGPGSGSSASTTPT